MGDSGSNRHVSKVELPRPLRNGVWPRVVGKLKLAPQQARIVELVMLCRGNKQIARELHLAEPTVRTYLDRTFDRLGVDNRMQLVVRVFEAAHEIHASERGHSG